VADAMERAILSGQCARQAESTKAR
jgi:thiazole synthase ThiGH ThiG subunit